MKCTLTLAATKNYRKVALIRQLGHTSREEEGQASANREIRMECDTRKYDRLLSRILTMQVQGRDAEWVLD